MNLYQYIKRAADFILSLLGLIMLCPVFLIIALLIKLDSRGPIFFKQKRIGKNKSCFYILKFRTMRTDTPKDMPTHLLQNPDAFITRTGKFLRRTSLDELPQIINILKGEMSIIGPRPALWNQYDLIDGRDKYAANEIYPGLTGWAQINGRDELSIQLKAELDGYYADNMSFMMDMKIFLKSFITVIAANGVVEGQIAAEKHEV